jgi:hypothetical protein
MLTRVVDTYRAAVAVPKFFRRPQPNDVSGLTLCADVEEVGADLVRDSEKSRVVSAPGALAARSERTRKIAPDRHTAAAYGALWA